MSIINEKSDTDNKLAFDRHTLTNRDLAKKLEIKSLERQSTLKTHLKNIWRSIVDKLSRPPEVRVWQSRDRQGIACWCAYNPTTGQQTCRFSEAEIIDWIERSYYFSSDRSSISGLYPYSQQRLLPNQKEK